MMFFGAIIIAAVCLYRAQETYGANEFKKCFNASMDMHCFDVQYESTSSQLLHTSVVNARKRCNDFNSTLIIIKDEEIQSFVQLFFDDSYNPVRANRVWTDAYRVNDFNDTFTWHWVNSTLPNVPASGVADTRDPGWYVAALEFKDNRFHLTAQQPHLDNRYVCEYTVSNCSSISFNDIRQFDGRCYVASIDQASFNEARNRCLKRGGDLASFANVTSINFTSWLISDINVRYWVGLRYAWYIWIDTGEKIRYSKWFVNSDDWRSSCLTVYYGNNGYSWYPQDCNSDNVYVVCHTVTSINPTTTSTTTTSTTITTTSTLTSSESFQNSSNQPSKEPSESRTPSAMAIGVGVGVGVGVPILIAIIVLVICIVVRKRRHETASSAQSTNRHQKESSIDQPYEAPTGNERDEIGETAYGTVVPSMLSRQAAEANGANSATEQTVYAPLQIL